MLFASLVLLLVIFLSLYVYLKWRYCTTSSAIPGLPPEFFIGNMRQTGLLSGRKASHEVFLELKQIYGDVFTFWFGPCRCLVFSRVDHVQHIFTSRYIYETSDILTSIFALMIPKSLFPSRNQKWKRHARVVVPMLKRINVLQYFDTILACTDRFIDTLLTKDDSDRKNLLSKCQELLLNITGSILLDHDLDGDSKKVQEKQPVPTQALKDFMHCNGQFLRLAFISKWLMKLYAFLNWKFQNANRIIRQYCTFILSEKRKSQQQTSSVNSKQKNISSFLLASLNDEANDDNVSSGLNHSELIDTIKGLFMASFDTTPTTLSWFIHYVSKNPHVQQRIKDELREHNLLPITDDIPLTSDILDALTYVECTVKEVLRCAPIATTVMRTALCDDLIDGTIQVRKGDTIFLATHSMHFDPRYWQIDPLQFAPERFLNEDKHHHPFAFSPFGGGHRACAGQNLAWFQLKTIIVRLMQRVTFEDTGMKNNSGGFEQDLVCYPKHLAVNVHVDNE